MISSDSGLFIKITKFRFKNCYKYVIIGYDDCQIQKLESVCYTININNNGDLRIGRVRTQFETYYLEISLKSQPPLYSLLGKEGRGKGIFGYEEKRIFY